jgi:uncharacterized protein (DUF2344 family)
LDFPQSVVLEKGLGLLNKELVKIEETQSFIAYKTSHTNKDKEYVDWCTKIVARNNNIMKQTAEPNGALKIQQALKNFNLANKTPMQAMEFVARLKSIAE